MLHIKDNIRLIRSLSQKKQEEFILLFSGVTVAMQKSYEGGKAKPGAAYIDRLGQLTGVSAADLMDKKLTGAEIKLNLKVEEVEYGPQNHFTADQLFHMYMKAMERQDRIMETQTGLLEAIKKEMAKESTQNDLTTNLNYVVAAVKKISKIQDSGLKEIRDKLAVVEQSQSDLYRDVHSKLDRNDGGGKKQGNRP